MSDARIRYLGSLPLTPGGRPHLLTSNGIRVHEPMITKEVCCCRLASLSGTYPGVPELQNICQDDLSSRGKDVDSIRFDPKTRYCCSAWDMRIFRAPQVNKTCREFAKLVLCA